MPMEKDRYPADWKRIALAVKEAAGWRCQECGKQCRRPGEKLDTHRRTLTVHHINMQPEDCRLENLIALCAPCHLRRHKEKNAAGQDSRGTAERNGKKMLVFRNRWMNLVREIRLGELMKLIPDDEYVIIFEDMAGAKGFQEEDALYNGEVGDWWKEKATVTDMPRMRVLGIQAREITDTVGPAIMIVVEF